MHHLQDLTRLLTQPSPTHLLELLGLVLVLGLAAYLASRTSVAAIAAVGIALEVFSGNWKYIPLPVPLDRVALLVAFWLLFWRGTRAVSDRRLVARPLHFAMIGMAGYVFANGLWAGTVTHSYGFYTWLDRLGVIPFVMFTFAPTIFGRARSRDVLVVVMTVLGLYLGYDAAVEMLGIKALVIPHYINNPLFGYQSGRARGPFLESDALGISLFFTGVFAALGAHRWAGKARWCCIGVMALDGLGIFFTLTRASWLGAFIGLVAAMVWHPSLRRRLPLVLAAAAVAVAVALLTVPGLEAKVTGRVASTQSIWDRYNTDGAALRIVAAHPLFGIGWQTFETKGPDYMHESLKYPLTGEGIEVHNVFLSHFAELGIPAALCWVALLLLAVGGSIVRRGPPELWTWRIALLAMFVMFLVEANLAPLSYPFPNLVIWLMAGIVGIGRYSVGREPEPAAPPADATVPVAGLTPVA
ncbi:MAG TPA: O-antigen ligase family protein [Acidimicrobiales bacterium]|nr:O-antigen ligase family protein [Acidimicrobiales bacterium]